MRVDVRSVFSKQSRKYVNMIISESLPNGKKNNMIIAVGKRVNERQPRKSKL